LTTLLLRGWTTRAGSAWWARKAASGAAAKSLGRCYAAAVRLLTPFPWTTVSKSWPDRFHWWAKRAVETIISSSNRGRIYYRSTSHICSDGGIGSGRRGSLCGVTSDSFQVHRPQFCDWGRGSAAAAVAEPVGSVSVLVTVAAAAATTNHLFVGSPYPLHSNRR